MWIRKKDGSDFVVGEEYPVGLVTLFPYPTSLVDNEGTKYPPIAFHDPSARKKLGLMVVDPTSDVDDFSAEWQQSTVVAYHIGPNVAVRVKEYNEIPLDECKKQCRYELDTLFRQQQPTEIVVSDEVYALGS